MSMFSGSKPAYYITSPNGKHTAVVMRRFFTAADHAVYPSLGKLLYRRGEGFWLCEGFEPPDASIFVWLGENTLQFEDIYGETQTIQF